MFSKSSGKVAFLRDYVLRGFKKALLQTPPRHDSGANFQ